MHRYLLLFFEVGGGEILLIMMVALIFFGSKNVPQIARGLGKGMREIRDASNSIKQEIAREADKIKEEAGVQRELRNIESDIKDKLEP
ncbi:MAG: twin-arginine translocase TatA/TatE family subunit [Bacteroidia bacterium]|jgi:sec-independent protein translocase protein TatA